MANGELFDKTETFRKAVASADARAARSLINAYGESFARVQVRLARIQREAELILAAGETLSKGLIARLWREQDLQRVIAREISRYSALAGSQITAEQLRLAGLAQLHTGQLVDAALPPAINRATLARAGLGWNEVPVSAIESLIGALGDGTPVTRTLESMGAPVANGVKKTLTDGLVRGLGPNQIARTVRNAYGVGLTRALTISRTETLRAYREGSRAAYAANPQIVKGYERRASNDDRTCMGCLGADGEFYPNKRPLPAHVNCRCHMVPVTRTYKELGINVPDPAIDFPSSEDWFKQQSIATQQKMMGAKKWDAWKSGQVSLKDFAHTTHDPIWGDAVVPANLAQLLG